ncbi:MAG: glycosyltransferase [Chloroflexaceae bacterium]
MNVLFCIDHLRGDGTQRILSLLAVGMLERGHRIAVLCLNDSWDDGTIEHLRRSGVSIRVVGKLGLLGGYGLVSTLRWMRRQHFDVAVTMLFWSDVIGRILARRAGIPRLVSSIRARNINYALWQFLLVRATMPLADVVVVNSRRIATFAVAAEGVPPERLVYIPNGVDLSLYTQPVPRALLREELGLSADAPVIGSVGRLTYQKGFDVLLQALARPGLEAAHLLLAGSGEEQERLQALARDLKIHDRIHFAGYRRDVPQWLGALDLYVHPSRFEGTPNILLEAMAAGCPIVATNVDGNGEILINGQHGWLVPPDHPCALADAIQTALDDPTEAHRRAQAAQERARHYFSALSMFDAWEKVLHLPDRQ